MRICCPDHLTCASEFTNSDSDGSAGGARVRPCTSLNPRPLPCAASTSACAASTTIEPPALFNLAQRERHTQGTGTLFTHIDPFRHQPNEQITEDYTPIQTSWKEYVRCVLGLCSEEFWDLFTIVNKEKGTCADSVLKEVKKLLKKQPRSKISVGHKWPSSRRQLRIRIKNNAGLFWDNVLIEKSIDMRGFAPMCKSVVKFTFVDPVFVWIRQANRLIQEGHHLHFKSSVLSDPNGAPMYGSGVQFGLLMRAALESMPRNGKPALMNLSWDGGRTGYGSRSSYPICIQVKFVHKTTNLLVC